MQITKRKLSRRRRVIQKRTKRLGRRTRKGRSTRRRAGQRGGECPDCLCCRNPFGNSAVQNVLVGFYINQHLAQDDEVEGGDFGRYEQIRDNRVHDMPQKEVERIGRVVKKACDRGCPHRYKRTSVFNAKCSICGGTKSEHDNWQRMGKEIREGNDSEIWEHDGVFGPNSVSPEDFYTYEEMQARRDAEEQEHRAWPATHGGPYGFGG